LRLAKKFTIDIYPWSTEVIQKNRKQGKKPSVGGHWNKIITNAVSIKFWLTDVNKTIYRLF